MQTHAHTYLNFSISESAKEDFLEEGTEEIEHYEGLYIEHAQTSVRAEQIDHGGVELLLLVVGIADDQACQRRGS